MFDLTAERPEDGPIIEDLLDLAFGSDRRRKTSYRYREGVAPVDSLRLVARDGDRIVGAIRYWPVTVGPARLPALLLGPIAVAPDRRGTGVGGALIFETIDRAVRAGHRLVLLVGDAAYYRRFGFQPAAPAGIFMPDEQPDRLQMMALTHDALDGAAGEVGRWEVSEARPSRVG
ncbi:MAG: GNAT family N-acetyltransferase [Inquilinaceae bacterium]